ncbi:WXG100 family type VII secretion target [Mycolicibacterium tusciae]|uniref:WXG100 family type VII secretion target n=1 Tax=Mycolicibacterium tusciae TaxID=75922 RepID=UPI00024A120D|nr:WXG100 family type VII secretion target [Mycolicibacterium tusciae]
MATSISAVAASQPERLVTAADEVSTQTTQLDNLITTQRDSINKLREGWSGSAADAAIARGEENLATQEALRDKLQTLQEVLSTGGGQLGSTRTALLDMVGQLRGQGWQISDAGVATPPPNLSEVFRSVPQAYTQMIQKLLKTYDGIDGETAARFPTFEGFASTG